LRRGDTHSRACQGLMPQQSRVVLGFRGKRISLPVPSAGGRGGPA